MKEAIAIVGIGCRTPGDVYGPDGLWRFLLSGKDGISTVPPDRWDFEEYYDPNSNKAGKIKSNRGGFIKGIDLFDNEFFHIFPKEAERMDPQQRVLLHGVFEALEDSGDVLANFRGSRTAVFMGTFMNDYFDIQVDPSNRYGLSPHTPMGTSLTSVANRISYLYDLKGPSVSLDTACSASLVSVHLACNSIWRGESDAAMAGGVNILINPESTVMMSKGNFLSPDGACKAFDARANGYVRSEGFGIVYLKPLSRALADHNRIYGLVRGSACNSDGYTPDGFTVPSSEAQTVVLRVAYADAGEPVSRVQYVEAHGTGTPVGDPLEARAFANVFGKRPRDQPLLIGSVKSNVGHLEGAAGVIGLIKLALSLHHKRIPGNLHFKNGNPTIDFVNWRLKVVDRVLDWPAPEDGTPRLGGVNSFGAGGTNAHVAMEEYVPKVHGVSSSSAPLRKPAIHLFTCSAQTADALKALLALYKGYLAQGRVSLNDLCYNAGRHRSLLTHRIAVAARTADELIARLDAFIQDGSQRAGVEYGVARVKTPRLGFVFTGQGPQWHAMGRQLIETEPVFREVIDRIEEHFVALAGWSLLDEMRRDEATSRVSDTRIAQPAIMAIQVALVEFWKLHGVEPQGVVGHSIGEVAAAYAAGALTLEQAVRVIFNRSRGQHAATGKGVMLAVGLSLPEVEKLIAEVSDVVSIGAVNSPESITLSGDEAPLRAIAEQLDRREVFNRFLKVNVPFHSHHMEPLKEQLISDLADLVPSTATLPLYSTVTGKQEDGQHLVSDYWFKNVRDPVYFSPALEQMVKDGFELFIEIGPHPALSVSADELFASINSTARIFPSIRRKEDELLRFTQTLGALAVAGVALDWDQICPGAQRLFDLPAYPWQLQSFWHESRAHKAHRLGRHFHPHVSAHHDSGLSADVHTFDIFLDRSADPYLEDHRVDNFIIFPATGHLELATVAARKAFGAAFNALEDVRFELGLFLPDEGEPTEIKLEVYSDEGRYCIMSRERSEAEPHWIRNSFGRMNCLDRSFTPSPMTLAGVQARMTETLPVQPLYNDLKYSGLYYGPTFRAIQGLWTVPGEILGKIALHESLRHGIENFLIHPSVLDACLHILFAAKLGRPDHERGVFLPVRIAQYKFLGRPKGNVVWSHVRVTECSRQYLNGEFIIFDEDGTPVAEVRGLECKYIAGSRKQEEDVAYSGCYEYRWQPAELDLQPGSSVELLLVGDASFDHGPLRAELNRRGAQVVTAGEMPGADHVVDLQDRDAVLAAMQAIRAAHPKLARIVSTLPAGQEGEHDLIARIETLSWKSLNLHHALIQTDQQPVLWTLARRSEVVLDDDREINLLQSVVYGMSRVLNTEYPLALAKVVDLALLGVTEVERLADLLLSGSSAGHETELAIRGHALFVKRLRKVRAEEAQAAAVRAMPASGSPYEGCFTERGILSSAAYRQVAPVALGALDVEVSVKAAALNFKDVLNGMGLLSAESVAGGLVGAQLGLECAGVVTRVGSGVTRFAPGDAVLAIAPRSIAGVAVTPEHCLVKKPEHVSFEEAAALGIVYLTAYHGLVDLAQLEPGERMLIHSGTGGVGIAAVRLAQLIGADVYATAGSDAKRAALRDWGVRHVYDSRSLDFHDQIRADTHGEGVDVVLNSLSGKAIVQSIKCLRAFGRFIEIGKTDIYDDKALHLKRFGENLAYFAVDIDRLMAQKPRRAARLFAKVIDLFEEQKLRPHPLAVFPVAQLPEALEHLSKGRQIGKVVLAMEGHQVQALPATSLKLNPRKLYLVTGGASGFGLELAKWMVERGARKLMLASRTGPKTDYDRSWIAALRQQGVEVLLPRVDLSVAEQAVDMIAQAHACAPIGGVIHSAAILHDSTIETLDRRLFRKVFDAKATSAWNLHQALGKQPVDFFLMLSSISSVFGLPGQSNYSSANHFLDKLVELRRLQGLAAQSAQLGVLADYAGMSRDVGSAVMNVLDKQGWIPMALDQIVPKVERVLLEGNVTRLAISIDWLRFRDFFANLRHDMKFAHLLTDEALDLKRHGGGDSLRDRVQALADGEAERTLQQALSEALARILGTTTDKLDITRSVSVMGLDSLMMNQLRNWIQQKLEINYPLMRMAKGPSIVELASQLRQELAKKGADVPAIAAEDTSGIATSDDLEMVAGWFVHHKPQPGAVPKRLKIFMFHSMGAGASMFAHFLYDPPTECDVYSVQLPGRENRSGETAHANLQPLLADLEQAILPLLDCDFVLYGHSYGGALPGSEWLADGFASTWNCAA